jgi:hypothetical protein
MTISTHRQVAAGETVSVSAGIRKTLLQGQGLTFYTTGYVFVFSPEVVFLVENRYFWEPEEIALNTTSLGNSEFRLFLAM